jgi:hypothetical protein
MAVTKHFRYNPALETYGEILDALQSLGCDRETKVQFTTTTFGGKITSITTNHPRDLPNPNVRGDLAR